MNLCARSEQFLLNSLEYSFLDVVVVVGEVGSDFQVLWLEIIELLHASSAEEKLVLLVFVVFLIGVIYLAESVSSSDVMVVAVYFRVDLVLHRPLFVEGYVLEVDMTVDGVDLVHHLDLLVLQAILQVLPRILDVGLLGLNGMLFF
jgi:hypothetical protein